jgi:hypothetical protein
MVAHAASATLNKLKVPETGQKSCSVCWRSLKDVVVGH